jgi:HEAT repeat protein
LARSEDATRIGGKSASEWVAVFKSDDRKSRSDAFGALMLFVPAVREVVPALVDTLDDPRRDVQIKAVRALREIGPGAVAAAPALVRGLGFRGPEMSIAIEAKEALAAIGPAALPSLVPCLEKNMTLGSPAKSWRRSEPWAASVRRQTVPFPI